MRIVLLALFIFGCASNEDKVFVDQVSPDLVETFKIKIKNNKFAKFLVEKKVSPVTPFMKVTKENTKKKVQKILITKKKEIIEVPQKAQEIVKETINAIALKKLPEDYPQELKNLDLDSAKTWANYKPLYRIGEELVFSIRYLGITAGHVRFLTQGDLEVAGQEALHFRALFKTSKFYKYIFEADDMVETYVTADKFLPIKYSLVQRESNKDVDDLQLFDREERKTYLFYKRLKKKNNQTSKVEKEAYLTEYYQDFMSTLFFVRGLALKKGDVYKFPVFTRGKFWRLTVTVVSTEEKIKVMGRWRKAIRIDTVALPPAADKKKKKSTISFWYSNDTEKIFLKLQAKLKFGSIEGELEEHIPGRIP
jgi:hypothetical protein